MSEHRDEHIELCAGWALDSLDPADRARLEAHLAEGCAACERALADFAAAATALGRSAPAAMPSPGLRARVLAAAGATAPEAAPAPAGRVVALPPRRRFPLVAALGWAAAAALAVVAGLFWRDARRLTQDLQASQRAAARLTKSLEEQRRWEEVLSAPGARVAVLAPTAAGTPGLRGRAVVDPATRRAMLMFDGIHEPPGRNYELWAIRGTAPRAIALLRPDSLGHAVVRLDDAGEPWSLNAYAVSLEPVGGSPSLDAPSGPVVMLGKF